MMNERRPRMIGRTLLHDERRWIARFGTKESIEFLARRGHFLGLHEELSLKFLAIRGAERGVGQCQQVFDLVRPFASLRIGVGRRGDAEAAQAANIVIGEEHVDVELARRGERLIEHVDGHVPPPFAAVDLPVRLQVAVDRLIDRELAVVNTNRARGR